MNGLARHLCCWGAHLMGFEPLSGRMLFAEEGGSPPPEAALEYLQKWHIHDPRNQLLFRSPPDTWIHCHEWLSSAMVESTPFYAEFLVPYGGRYASGMHFSASTDLLCVFSVQRGIQQNPIEGTDRVWLERIGRHVKAAFLLQSQARQRFAPAIAGQSILQRMDCPVLLVDDERRAIFTNGQADLALQHGRPIHIQGGQLAFGWHGTQHHDVAELEQSLRLSRQCRAVFLGLDWQNSFLLAIDPLQPEETLGAFGSKRLSLVRLFNLKQSAVLSPQLVAMAFDLTPAEARVAIIMAEGKSDLDISRQNGVAVTTVRTQAQRVLDKIGVGKRSEVSSILKGNPAFWLDGGTNGRNVIAVGRKH
ncbi:MAG: helix-turn-helix transcriptional regulator [Burkholderiales bacterium]|nr:helix-turn-helix transcriptional regulator [Burkholderiales bacterium]